MTEAATVAEGRVLEFTTQSGADTVAVGRKLVEFLKPPQLLLLRGGVGLNLRHLQTVVGSIAHGH